MPRDIDGLIDAIDQLVDNQLTHDQDDYHAPYALQCLLCRDEWHGLPDSSGCPGSEGYAKVVEVDGEASCEDLRLRVEHQFTKAFAHLNALNDEVHSGSGSAEDLKALLTDMQARGAYSVAGCTVSANSQCYWKFVALADQRRRAHS
jgi:hypothetical protein